MSARSRRKLEAQRAAWWSLAALAVFGYALPFSIWLWVLAHGALATAPLKVFALFTLGEKDQWQQSRGTG